MMVTPLAMRAFPPKVRGLTFGREIPHKGEVRCVGIRFVAFPCGVQLELISEEDMPDTYIAPNDCLLW